MRRLPSEDGFLFTSSRIGLLRSGVPAWCFPFGPHLAPWLPSILRLCSTWRGSWEYWLVGSNRVDLSPPASLRIRDPFLHLATLFQTSVGLTRCANAPCLPSDARVSYLSRFLMRRLPSEDGFLFTSSRIGLLLSGVPERSALLADYTSPPGFSPSCDFDPPRSRKVTLLPPLSPFGQVPALLPFPFLGRFDCSLHRPRWPVPALLLSQTTCTGCALRDWYGRLFTVRLLWVTLPLGP